MIGHGTAEEGQALRVEHHGVEHQRDERPRLFRVPAPVGSPTYVCPYCPDENADGEADDGRMEEQEAQHLQLPGMAAQAERHDGADKGEREQGVTYHYGADVKAEQRTVEYGHHLSDGRVHLVEMAHKEEES